MITQHLFNPFPAYMPTWLNHVLDWLPYMAILLILGMFVFLFVKSIGSRKSATVLISVEGVVFVFYVILSILACQTPPAKMWTLDAQEGVTELSGKGYTPIGANDYGRHISNGYTLSVIKDAQKIGPAIYYVPRYDEKVSTRLGVPEHTTKVGSSNAEPEYTVYLIGRISPDGSVKWEDGLGRCAWKIYDYLNKHKDLRVEKITMDATGVTVQVVSNRTGRITISCRLPGFAPATHDVVIPYK